ncbi:hypothetical protein KAZ82_01670 [Candidatus Babeliales bacterium]|nr:hypothetical protein [Candidatus Babeliales bacterium]
MKKFALILSLISYELTAIENMAKYLIPATLICGIAVSYCHKQWLSSAEYLTFVNMQNKLKKLGMIEITTEATGRNSMYENKTFIRYINPNNISYPEFYNLIDQYEIAKNKTINLWSCAELLMRLGTLSALVGTLICLLVPLEKNH